MIATQGMIYIHGLLGTGQGFKANHLRAQLPGILTPDFRGSLEERMAQLYPLLEQATGWRIVGSSFGGLMGALFTCQRPERVDKLVLLAPALVWPEFASQPAKPVDVPTIIYHGRMDDLIPLEEVQTLASQVFNNLTFNPVDDDHGLRNTVENLDWPTLLLA